VSVQIHSYLDDSLIKDFDQQTLASQTEMVIQPFANVEEDKTVGAKCGNALAEQLPRVS
jgi:hypothetical protein